MSKNKIPREPLYAEAQRNFEEERRRRAQRENRNSRRLSHRRMIEQNREEEQRLRGLLKTISLQQKILLAIIILSILLLFALYFAKKIELAPTLIIILAVVSVAGGLYADRYTTKKRTNEKLGTQIIHLAKANNKPEPDL